MKVKVLHGDDGRCAVVYVDSLVLTVSHNSQGYEVLAEMDTDEASANVPVTICTATGDEVKWDL
jgi:uncharacterized protein YtpQ (UPF0354 family)